MTCMYCGRDCGENANFCPSCGKKPGQKMPYTDFELGRIAALDGIKREVLGALWSRVAAIGILLTLLAAFGVDDIIKDRVGSAVNKQLEDKQKIVDSAMDRAQTVSAEAVVRTNEADDALQHLNAKKEALANTVEELEKSIDVVDGEKAAMLKSISSLQDREARLNQVIASENLTAAFAKLRNDLYTIHSMGAEVEVRFLKPLSRDTTLNLLSMVPRTVMLARDLDHVVEFAARDDEFTTLTDNDGNVVGVVILY